nr:MAG TPA: Protein of unknown function (DUF1365) [Caudoviricetes sp.]
MFFGGSSPATIYILSHPELKSNSFPRLSLYIFCYDNQQNPVQYVIT